MNTSLKIAAWVGAGALGLGMVGSAVAGARTERLATTDDTIAALSAAADGSTAETPAPQARKGRPGRAGGPAMRMARRLVHGEFTVKTKDGFEQVFLQKGAVTSVSASSIELKSPDGFTKAYPVSADTKVRKDKKKAAIGDVKTGDKALVLGSVKDGSYTLRMVVVPPAKAAAGKGNAGAAGFSPDEMGDLAA